MGNILQKIRKGLTLTLGRTDVYSLWPLERLLIEFASSRPQHPSLFILGLPRSGTTLIYQYLVHRLQVAYFTNNVGRYFMSPCLATWWRRRFSGEYRSRFESAYGDVPDPLGPHEAGKFWGRFFGFEDYISPKHVSASDARILSRTLACVQSLFGGTVFVNKNVKHLLRLPALYSIYPNAFFLQVQREHKDVALSLLRARYATLDNPSEWLSAKPPNHSILANQPVAKQIANQVKALDQKIEEDLSHLPPDRVLSINYRAFCNQPDRLTRMIRSRIQPVPFRNPQIEQFSPSTNQPQSAEERRVVSYLNELS